MSGATVTGGYARAEDLPQVVPVFPLDGALLLPRGGLPLNIFEPRYLNMIDDAMAGDRLIGMVQTRPGGDRSHPELAPVGCVGRITSYSETADGRYLITLTGICRFMLGQELPVPTPYRQVRADFHSFEEDLRPSPSETAFSRPRLLRALKAYLARRSLDVNWSTAEAAPAEALINSLAMALPFEPPEKQALLEADSLEARESALVALLEIDAAARDDDDDIPVQ
jgi:Lon protease-like protein